MASTMLGETVLLAEATISHDLNTPKDHVPTVRLQPSTNLRTDIEECTSIDQKKKDYKLEIVWRNILIFVYLHIGCIYGLYLTFTACKRSTTLTASILAIAGGIGITGGAHRLWAHKAYKTRWPATVILLILQTLALQNSVYEWVRDHRVHHKFTDTDADPHNSRRGFFFSHVGWLLCKKHPDVKDKGKTVSLKDLEADPLVMFQHKFYVILAPIVCFVIPTLIPYILYGETFTHSYYVCGIARYVITLNFTWLVNSAAHMWGDKPYDKSISPTNTFWVSFCTSGEGFHNYHHVFPWDYKAAELGSYYGNGTTAIIELFAKLGWAYDLKTVPTELIKRRILRTGDGSHILSRIQQKLPENWIQNSYQLADAQETQVWGWDDPDMDVVERKLTNINLKLD